MSSLLKSRKFWLAVFGVVQSLVLYYLAVPEPIWMSIDALVLTVIATITVEDVAKLRAGVHPVQVQQMGNYYGSSKSNLPLPLSGSSNKPGTSKPPS